MPTISLAADAASWDAFLSRQRFRPFLQSWTMGEVYGALGQEPIRLTVHNDAGEIEALCLAIVVPAKRGRHLAVQYGPVLSETASPQSLPLLVHALHEAATAQRCTFLRLSPFVPQSRALPFSKSLQAPMHLLAEHIWYLPLTQDDLWAGSTGISSPRTAEEILMNLRKTTRNLVRRAEKEGVTITASPNPTQDVEQFIRLHDDTRKRHGFTPYTNAYFRAQVEHFAPRGECTVYLAHYQGNLAAASIHMHTWGETSYHHGASATAFSKIPVSYLLQWQAIQDALKRGDHIYNFWGIAPMNAEGTANKRHPFAGVTTFKTGFGGNLLELQPCRDVPLAGRYWLTRAVETLRKWKRGF